MLLIDHQVPAPGTMLLIQEKIALPFPPPGIRRPRLLNLLKCSLETCTTTVISGRAGTGKTTLAVDFARSCGRRVTWYKVDATDVEPEIFLSYLVSSIRQQLPGFGERTLAARAQPHLHFSTGPADTFIFELIEYDREPLLVVLEDLHLICEGEWLVPFLCRLLPLLPRKVHILITSRTMPPAPLWRMRSKQTLQVIDEPMLAFTRPEALALFEMYGLSSELARAAYDRSRGKAGSIAAYARVLSSPLTGEHDYSHQFDETGGEKL
jgi:LuxR family maltose regulon positive regulatory protein